MPWTLLALIFVVAVVYASVGHGGASGYLAALSLVGLAPAEMAAGALCLNLLVAGIAFVAYWRVRCFDWKLFWPFAVASVPAAFIGGLWHIPKTAYIWLLSAVLLWAAFRLAGFRKPVPLGEDRHPPSLGVSLPVGAGLGLLSGLVGVGGGIFLSPLLLLAGWADAKKTAAVSAGFIWVNSVAALYGHLQRQTLYWTHWGPWVLAAFLGGLLGSYLGTRHLNGLALRRILAIVLVLAAMKLMRASA